MYTTHRALVAFLIESRRKAGLTQAGKAVEASLERKIAQRMREQMRPGGMLYR
jgi:hypothetical protein